MTESDHGDFPIAVRMTSQLFHTLLLRTPSHIQLILPTSSNVIADEYDGIHPPDMSRDIDACADTRHDASPSIGKSINQCLVNVPCNSRSQCPCSHVTTTYNSNPRSQCPRPHVTTNDSRQCSHDHLPTYDISKYRSAPLLTNGVPQSCHVMHPCCDPESTYGRDPGSHAMRISTPVQYSLVWAMYALCILFFVWHTSYWSTTYSSSRPNTTA